MLKVDPERPWGRNRRSNKGRTTMCVLSGLRSTLWIHGRNEETIQFPELYESDSLHLDSLHLMECFSRFVLLVTAAV